jgi:hypothetical protein
LLRPETGSAMDFWAQQDCAPTMNHASNTPWRDFVKEGLPSVRVAKDRWSLH